MTDRGAAAATGLATWTSHYALLAPGRIEWIEEQLPPLARDWVRVRFAYCGLCGSDVSHFAGARRVAYPVSLGHEWVAVVEAAGPGVGFFGPGDVVTTDLNFRCGRCRHCAGGRSHLCEEGQVARFTNRGFGIRADIHASYLHKCRHDPAPHLALAEPLSCTMHALGHCLVSAADRVLVIGAGGLGTCISFLLSTVGPMATFDVTDVDSHRLAQLGRAIIPRGRAVEHPTDEYDVVLDMSGTPTGLRAACERVGRGGRLCTMSHLPHGTTAEFLLEELIHKDVTVSFSYLNGDAGSVAHAITLLEDRWDATWTTLLDVRPLHALPEIFGERPASPSNKVVIDCSASAPGDVAEARVEVARRDPAHVARPSERLGVITQ